MPSPRRLGSTQERAAQPSGDRRHHTRAGRSQPHGRPAAPRHGRRRTAALRPVDSRTLRPCATPAARRYCTAAELLAGAATPLAAETAGAPRPRALLALAAGLPRRLRARAAGLRRRRRQPAVGGGHVDELAFYAGTAPGYARCPRRPFGRDRQALGRAAGLRDRFGEERGRVRASAPTSVRRAGIPDRRATPTSTSSSASAIERSYAGGGIGIVLS